MSTTKAIAIAAAGLSIASMALTTWLPSQETSVADKLNFAGKIVTVYTDATGEGTGDILRELEVTKIEGNVVVTGIGVDTGHPDDWTAGLRIVIPWDKIESFYIMDEKQFDEKIKGAVNRL